MDVMMMFWSRCVYEIDFIRINEELMGSRFSIYFSHIFFCIVKNKRKKVHGGPVYTDCEDPPTILHGRTELAVVDDGSRVYANYRCDQNYKLFGTEQLECDTDTDEWQGNLPECILEGEQGIENSSSAPIDTGITSTNESEKVDSTPAIIVEAATPPTHYDQVTESSNSLKPEILSTELSSQEQQPKKNVSTTPEDDRIDNEFASRLDSSCSDGVAAPSIEDSFVQEYI